MFEALFNLLNKPSKKSTKEIAKNRLKVVLIHDRANLSPEMMQNLRNDIIEVISHYMDINKEEMDLSLAKDNSSNSVALVANIPVSRIKHRER